MALILIPRIRSRLASTTALLSPRSISCRVWSSGMVIRPALARFRKQTTSVPAGWTTRRRRASKLAAPAEPPSPRRVTPGICPASSRDAQRGEPVGRVTVEVDQSGGDDLSLQIESGLGSRDSVDPGPRSRDLAVLTSTDPRVWMPWDGSMISPSFSRMSYMASFSSADIQPFDAQNPPGPDEMEKTQGFYLHPQAGGLTSIITGRAIGLSLSDPVRAPLHF